MGDVPGSSSARAPPRQPSGVFAPSQDYAQLGMTAGMTLVCGSVVVGAVAYSRGNKALFDRLFRMRMVVVATTFGFYAAASGFLPPPPLLSTVLGREPRAPQHEVPPLLPRAASTQQQQQQPPSR